MWLFRILTQRICYVNVVNISMRGLMKLSCDFFNEELRILNCHMWDGMTILVREMVELRIKLLARCQMSYWRDAKWIIGEMPSEILARCRKIFWWDAKEIVLNYYVIVVSFDTRMWIMWTMWFILGYCSKYIFKYWIAPWKNIYIIMDMVYTRS